MPGRPRRLEAYSYPRAKRQRAYRHWNKSTLVVDHIETKEILNPITGKLETVAVKILPARDATGSARESQQLQIKKRSVKGRYS